MWVEIGRVDGAVFRRWVGPGRPAWAVGDERSLLWLDDDDVVGPLLRQLLVGPRRDQVLAWIDRMSKG